MPAERDPAILQEVALLRGLPPERLEELAPMLHERSFPANTNVITAEERGEGVYAILSGTVKVYVTDAGGAEVIIAVLGTGEIVGEMSLADSLGRSASVLTLERSSFLWMDRSTLLASIHQYVSPLRKHKPCGAVPPRGRLDISNACKNLSIASGGWSSRTFVPATSWTPHSPRPRLSSAARWRLRELNAFDF